MLTNRISVLFVIIQMQMGGSERLVHSLISKLDRNNFDPSVAWFSGHTALQEFIELGVPLFNLPKASRWDLALMQKVGKIIANNNIDIVNAHHFMPMVYSYYGVKNGINTKLIYTEHSSWEIDRIPFRWRLIGNILLSRIDGIIGVSDEVSSSIKSKFIINDRMLVTIKNGVDIDAYNKRIIDDLQNLRKSFDISHDDVVLGMVANYKKIKNHLFLLRAFKDLSGQFENLKLLLIGRGFEKDPDNSEGEIRKFVYSNDLSNSVILTGYRSDVPDLLRIIDIFCLTSFKEGLPISLIEAMATGLPVVGTSVEGIDGLIEEGRNGFLVHVGDISGLKNSLMVLINDRCLRYRFGNESKRIANGFSLSHCVASYERLFLSVARKA